LYADFSSEKKEKWTEKRTQKTVLRKDASVLKKTGLTIYRALFLKFIPSEQNSEILTPIFVILRGKVFHY
jgi:hypothetical protein